MQLVRLMLAIVQSFRASHLHVHATICRHCEGCAAGGNSGLGSTAGHHTAICTHH